jgi:hypothetical protein
MRQNQCEVWQQLGEYGGRSSRMCGSNRQQAHRHKKQMASLMAASVECQASTKQVRAHKCRNTHKQFSNALKSPENRESRRAESEIKGWRQESVPAMQAQPPTRLDEIRKGFK